MTGLESPTEHALGTVIEVTLLIHITAGRLPRRVRRRGNGMPYHGIAGEVASPVPEGGVPDPDPNTDTARGYRVCGFQRAHQAKKKGKLTSRPPMSAAGLSEFQ